MPAEQALTVLVAEDGAADLLLLAQIVRRQGHQVLTAENGEQAVALFVERRPQLVLLDALMPVMDGFEAARRLRALQNEGRLPRFPIVALTAHAGDADRRQSEAAGMDGHLTKPILLDALKDALGRWLR